MTVRVTLDATPLLGPRTGVGRYVEGLVGALADPSRTERGMTLRIGLTAFTARGAGGLREHAPDGVRVVHRPAPARALQWLWGRTAMPPVELLAGRCDVFHATNFVLPPALRAAGVVTVHDLTYVRHPDTTTGAVQRYRRLVPRSVRRAALVLCPAEATADDVAEHFGLDRERVRATPLGVGQEWFDALPLTADERAAAGLPPEYVLFVGTREPRKDLPVLLAAHAAANEEAADLPELVLAGPAGWGPPAERPGIVRTGWLGDEQLRRVVAGARALVLPSRYEGFGLPLLEALATGVPVVASDLPVHREVTGGCADLFPVGDVDALAQVLVGVARRPPDPEATARRRHWAGRFTWAECARRTALAYLDAAS